MNGFFAGFAIALLVWFFVFLYLKAFVRRRTSPDYILELLQKEVRELEADIDKKTEQNLELLEEKILALREICGEAERRIAVYSRELEKRSAEKETMTALNNKSAALKTGKKTAKKDKIVPIRNPKAAAAAYRHTPPSPKGEVPHLPESAITFSHEELAIKPRPVKERIAELEKAGLPPELIAKRLDLNPEEVRLYFKLSSSVTAKTPK
jgi:DNA-binding Lrp family transcriptional regulator